MKKITKLISAFILCFAICACSCNKEVVVPKADAGNFDMNAQTFGVDKNVNVETIDKYLNL